MNKAILQPQVQDFLFENSSLDVNQVALSKSSFPGISGQELSMQLASRKKAEKKLPDWFKTKGVYYPPLLSMEQCSSETTAEFKATLVKGESLIDLTGGFGVDCYYFARKFSIVIHCEYNAALSDIAASNAHPLQEKNIQFINGDGIEYLKASNAQFDCIYLDPARRAAGSKVFQLKDCSPDVVQHLGLLLSRSNQVMVKTAPLLDISAGLKELTNVAEVHIISVKNECKELIWILKRDFQGSPEIVAHTINDQIKHFSFRRGEEKIVAPEEEPVQGHYLYEPDVALLKSGAFQLIAERYGLYRIHPQTQLYHSVELQSQFPGRIFKIDSIKTAGELKKEKGLMGNVIVRNYPDKAAALVSKYRIQPEDHIFYLFTQSTKKGKIIIKARIIQHY
ncbi:class I SAM-dependent methyltransferase [Pedobacter antarcticus]|uniref:class I SAM-dependent methyltransferase n=1 Tax=Pedobacter antarcticus TaxID=34086 RepID=UPI00088FF13C|nr:class I SAM-dependent methyltransferase [Pedobacter antarcticus]SDM60738.1 Methyltransferase domain-containing protein [Pedobacter antarcticus]